MLVIRDVNELDAGTYECVGMNKIGLVKATAELKFSYELDLSNTLELELDEFFIWFVLSF